MLKKLLARHGALKLGASLLGASALAVGFASPALAAQSSGGTAASLNYNIFQGGSNTTYLMMEDLSTLFNESPGCDLASSSGTPQPLDYGCPGLNDPGTTLSKDTSQTVTGNLISGSAKVKAVSDDSIPDLGQLVVSDSAGVIPAGTHVKSVNFGADNFKLTAVATGNATGDTITLLTGPAVGENGLVPFAQQNPFNDYLVQEPALGSSNGIQELENQGTHGVGYTSHGTAVNTAPLDVARSSRAPNLTSGTSAGDYKGLNFVAYAQDAVTWMHWTKVNNVSTPSASISNLSLSTLTSIWNGTLSCTISGVNYTENWICLGGSAAPIALYMAQNGSGTEATWQSLLGLTGTFPFGGEKPSHVIFENQTASILTNGDEANAIFLFSYGKYKAECSVNPAFCSGSSTSTTALGQINGIAASQTTIAAQLPGAAGPVFPGDRLVYNVYSNGSNSNIPTSSSASLNAVSEDGFLCKPSTKSDVDPNTGTPYLTEIDKVIKAQGFFPLPLEVENGQGATGNPLYNTTASGIPNPAWTTGGLSASAYAHTGSAPWNFPAPNRDDDVSAVSGTYSGVYDGGTTGTVTATATNPVGYCLTMSSDGNSTS